MNRKTLIIVENLPVPFDSRVWKEACALHKSGYQVTVLCPKGEGYEKSYEMLEGIHVYRHPASKEGNSSRVFLVDFHNMTGHVDGGDFDRPCTDARVISDEKTSPIADGKYLKQEVRSQGRHQREI